MKKIVLMANDYVGLMITKDIVSRGDEIVRLYLHEEHNSKMASEIIDASKCSQDQIFYANSLKNQTDIESLKQLNADFIITVYWAYLLKPDVINSVKDTVNFHPALLPINRGWFPHVHSILDGTPLGVTIHRIDEGADTGPIWAQKEVQLLNHDTAKTVYIRLQEEIINLFAQNWDDIKNGNIKPFEQDHNKAIYHSKNEINDLDLINLNKKMSARELINILRARSFGDLGFAYFEENNKKVFLNLRLSETSNFIDN